VGVRKLLQAVEAHDLINVALEPLERGVLKCGISIFWLVPPHPYPEFLLRGSLPSLCLLRGRRALRRWLGGAGRTIGTTAGWGSIREDECGENEEQGQKDLPSAKPNH